MKVIKIVFQTFILIFINSFNSYAEIGPRIFEIERNGQISYLFGTIHTGLDFNELPLYIKKLVEESNTVVLETDLKGADVLISQNFPMGEKGSLRKVLTETEWTNLIAILSPLFKGNELTLERLNPTIALMLINSISFKKTNEPIDRTLELISINMNKNLLYFETVNFQIELLKQIFTIKELKLALNEDSSKNVELAEKILKAYLNGNIEELNLLMISNLGEKHNEIVINRNLNWLSKFDSIFDQPGIEFFAVGAGHLAGEYGLIKLLREKGYSLKQL